jgi:ABC-type polysaccharide/polyol phosphate export permease
MGILVFVCFAVATILAALAAFYRRPQPLPVNLLAVALFFLALGFTLQAWGAAGQG